MTEEQFRAVLWKSLFLAEYQVRYWERYYARIQRIAAPIKIILLVSGILSLVGLIVLEKYRLASAILGTIAAFISTVIIPALGWDGVQEKVAGLHNDWINVRTGYRSIWNELDDVDQSISEKQFATWNARDEELERRITGLPKINAFREAAFTETEQFMDG